MDHKQSLTLIELVVVILVLIALAGLLVPLFGESIEVSRERGSVASLHGLREVIMGRAQSPGYLQDTQSLPGTLKDLYVLPAGLGDYDPVTKLGWRGPYVLNGGAYDETIPAHQALITAGYGANEDPCPLDAHGNPVIIQVPTTGTPEQQALNTRIVSVGPDGVLDCLPTDLIAANRGDDLVLFLRKSDIP